MRASAWLRNARRWLRTLVGVMHDLVGAALSQRHVERREHQLCAKMIGHGPPGRDDPAHKEGSAWAGRGAEELGLSGPVDSDAFRAILEGKVPGGRQLGRKDLEGNIQHRPGRDALSAQVSVPPAVVTGAIIDMGLRRT